MLSSTVGQPAQRGAGLAVVLMDSFGRLSMGADQESLDISTPWMTAEQTAAYLSVALGTIRNWTSQKRIPHARRGGLVRYHRDEIDKWLKAGACKGRLAPACSTRASAE